MTVKSVDGYNSATNRGTRIVKNGQEMDKNAFLQILSVQLMHQDPSNPQDPSQFVSQLAEFTALEQMMNLNSNTAFSGAQNLVGKTVALDKYNHRGEQLGGVVTSVLNENNDPKVVVRMMENGKLVEKKFSYSDVAEVIDSIDPVMGNMLDNLEFMANASYIGKEIKATDGEKMYVGEATATYKDKYGVAVVVQVTDLFVNDAMKKGQSYIEQDIYVRGVYEGDEEATLKIRYNKYSDNDDKYEYAFVKDGQDEDEIEWTTFKDGDKIQGLEVTLPKENPNLDAEWSMKLEKIEPKEMHFLGNNILEVSKK